MENIDTDIETRSFHIARLLNAPVEKVWQAWINPEQIAQWWGPEGFTNDIQVMDMRPGGEWRLTMHGPDGKRYPNKSIFGEIIPLKKIVFQHFNPDYLATILFEPKGGQTLLRWTMVFPTEELFETVVKVFKADKGLEQNVTKLEAYLKNKTGNN